MENLLILGPRGKTQGGEAKDSLEEELGQGCETGTESEDSSFKQLREVS